MRTRLLATVAFVGLILGLALLLFGASDAGHIAWAAVIVLLIVPEATAVARTLLSGRLGVDSIALLAMATALVMGEYLAGAVVAMMLSGGNALEEWAAGRSRRELKALLERAPSEANLIRDGQIERVPVDQIAVGDLVSVRAAEVLPVDGKLVSPHATVDESALTGESLPVEHSTGGRLRSGTTNAGEAFELRATHTVAESSYARLVELVRAAEDNRAPFVRMADRYAALLLVVTLVLGLSAWALSGESIRFLAVLVVATPCPLILAAPIAFVAGISRAAARGVIVKGGAAVEGLGRARSVLLDKTGTLTIGTPHIERIEVVGEITEDEILRVAASVDQMSTHVLADALVAAADQRGLELSLPEDLDEVPGEGILGRVDGRAAAVGSAALLRRQLHDASWSGDEFVTDHHHARVFVAVDGHHAGTIVLADRLRDDAGDVRSALEHNGVKHVAMVTGDHATTAHHVAAEAGIEEVWSDQSPSDKVAVVERFKAAAGAAPVVMVGDGINDAPALATADVGIAMSTSGVTASTEAADVVVTVPEIGRVVEAIAIGRRSHRIALESVLVGIGLSVVAMVFAALGMIPPVAGALLQEVIDVAVILNALRALR